VPAKRHTGWRTRRSDGFLGSEAMRREAHERVMVERKRCR
jgi:hypothetical protein